MIEKKKSAEKYRSLFTLTFLSLSLSLSLLEYRMKQNHSLLRSNFDF